MSDRLKEIVDVGMSYPPDWQIDEAEAERLAWAASERMRTMNGDTGTVTVTVRQLSQLLAAWVFRPETTEGALRMEKEFERLPPRGPRAPQEVLNKARGRDLSKRILKRLDERLEEMERAGTLNCHNPETRALSDAMKIVEAPFKQPAILPPDGRA
jgi:hypothetical protein